MKLILLWQKLIDLEKYNHKKYYLDWSSYEESIFNRRCEFTLQLFTFKDSLQQKQMHNRDKNEITPTVWYKPLRPQQITYMYKRIKQPPS